ncbi:YncE family protein [Acidobacteria bacterium AH-259-A15]|nr:YncE family protein [Acidobacteria bacterium AH-259-A15]
MYRFQSSCFLEKLWLTVLLAFGFFMTPLCAEELILLVSQKAASSVAFYTFEGRLLSTVPVGLHPHEIVLSRDGAHLYVTDNGTMSIEQAGEGGNTVSIIDVRSRKRTGTVSLGRYHRPHGIDVHPRTGHVFVSTENPDQLIVIDPESREIVRRYDTKGRTSHIVTLSPDGEWAYVSNSRSGNVSAIELSSGEVTLIVSGDRPAGSVISRDGKRLYVTNRNSNTIAIIDTTSKSRLGLIQTGRDPVRVALSRDEKTLIYGLGKDQKVGFAEIQTRREVALVDLDGAPVSMNLSADGRWALTAAQQEDTVYLVSVEGRKLVRKFKVASGAGPDPVVLVGHQ